MKKRRKSGPVPFHNFTSFTLSSAVAIVGVASLGQSGSFIKGPMHFTHSAEFPVIFLCSFLLFFFYLRKWAIGQKGWWLFNINFHHIKLCWSDFRNLQIIHLIVIRNTSNRWVYFTKNEWKHPGLSKQAPRLSCQPLIPCQLYRVKCLL